MSPSHFPAGILACLDGYMNIAMEQTEEYVNGQLKNKYGDAFIRGNNGSHHTLSLCQNKLPDSITFTSGPRYKSGCLLRSVKK